MTQNQMIDSTSLTANSDRPTFAGKTAPRRWWRAIDQFTLETMNAPIPARVRAAMSSNDFDFSPATDFAAAIRASAPGRSKRMVGPDAHGSDFAAGIRANAPGRRS